MPPDDAAQALGFLLADAMFNAMESLRLYGACCPRCCGACTALQWYRDHAPADADYALRSIWDGTDLDRWDFQRVDGGVDWKVIEEAWELADLRGCHTQATAHTDDTVRWAFMLAEIANRRIAHTSPATETSTGASE